MPPDQLEVRPGPARGQDHGASGDLLPARADPVATAAGVNAEMVRPLAEREVHAHANGRPGQTPPTYAWPPPTGR